MTAEAFLYGWLLSLMSNCIPLEYMHLVIDKFRVQGWIFMYKLVITYLLFLKEGLLHCEESSEFLTTLSNTSSKELGLHWHEILDNCYKLELWLKVYQFVNLINFCISSLILLLFSKNYYIFKQRFQMTYRECRNLCEMLRSLNYPRLVSLENFMKPNF